MTATALLKQVRLLGVEVFAVDDHRRFQPASRTVAKVQPCAGAAQRLPETLKRWEQAVVDPTSVAATPSKVSTDRADRAGPADDRP